MTIEEMEENVFTLVSSAGESRALAYEALTLAESGDFAGAENKVKEAEEVFVEAHKVQTRLIHQELGGETMPFSLLFMHAEDHLMTCMAERELVKKLITVHQKMHSMDERLKKLEG
jgi:PTS system cellobiose-specific IIA component